MADQIDWVQRILASVTEGVALVGEPMVDRPVILRARSIMGACSSVVMRTAATLDRSTPCLDAAAHSFGNGGHDCPVTAHRRPL
jgi:hypothetical protein